MKQRRARERMPPPPCRVPTFAGVSLVICPRAIAETGAERLAAKALGYLAPRQSKQVQRSRYRFEPLPPEAGEGEPIGMNTIPGPCGGRFPNSGTALRLRLGCAPPFLPASKGHLS